MDQPETTDQVSIRLTNGERIRADLGLPPAPLGLVVFAHGSGSSRLSPRNRAVAAGFRQDGLGTLLLDLLTSKEEIVDAITREHRFNIEKLAERVVFATEWIRRRQDTKNLRIGYFGASTGAAAALQAAARVPTVVDAVVSRGGRPDLAGDALDQVHAPTLLIVGGHDEPVIEMNENALRRLPSPSRIEIVPGATRLFEEPGAMEEVQRLASAWFQGHLDHASGSPMARDFLRAPRASATSGDAVDANLG